MHPRKRFDIAWSDLATGLFAAAFCGENSSRARLESLLPFPSLPVLSIRSGLDLALQAYAWPQGSKVLVSALTIPDMRRVIETHGLVVVPIDVDPATLAPDLKQAEALVDEQTRAILLAHLFGVRLDLAPWHALSEAQGLRLWEDAAQAFTCDSWIGDAPSDLVFFSFGPIKNATALGGGIVRVRDQALLATMQRLQADWPLQPRRHYAARCLKYALLKPFATRTLFPVFTSLSRMLGLSIDQAIHSTVRGFSPAALLEQLRHRPSAPLLQLIARRWSQGLRRRLRRQRELGEHLLMRLAGRIALAGERAPTRWWWVAVALVDDPDALVASLRAAGFDATRQATLACIGDAAGTPVAAAAAARFVYLPLHAEMGAAEVDRMADKILAADASGCD